MSRRVVVVAAVFAACSFAVASEAAFIATCPTSPAPDDRIYALDGSGFSAECFATGTGNSLTGGESDTFLSANPSLSFLDYDGPPNETDNGFYYTNSGNIVLDGKEWIYGSFNFTTVLTDPLNNLYLGFKVGNVDPTWAVFRIYGFADNVPLSGTFYTTPKQGGGISHAAVYGEFVPPDVDPDPSPVVPEPATLALLGTGLVGAAAAARRRRTR